jgi:hypothetical protein
MSRSRLCLLTVCSIVLTLAPAAALAQSPYEPGEWIVSPVVGIALDGDADVTP